MSDDAPKARGYHHGDLRKALLDAALEVLNERGIASLSLREVARRTGVSHGAPAHHFGDKKGLLTALAAEGFRRFVGALGRAAEAQADPVVALSATGRAYVHFAVEHRALFELMFRPEHLNQEAPELREAMERSYQALLNRVIDAQAAGYLPDQQAEEVALSAWTTVHGLATLWNDGNLQVHVGEDLDTVLDMVLVASARSSAT